MKPVSGKPHRHLSTSPFKPPSSAPPAERFSVNDQVSHDRYGLGVVIGVEAEAAVLVDFGSRQERITTPFHKLYKL
jgi:alkanesulfonate monooxygenase SsuD/methylene tetrahydromethanopterin reductase-like flavin-dependent oxidoreductase (luciferase family)